MCLILLAYEAHPRYALVVAANRDEFYERPTAPAAPWEDAPQVIAGRDLRGGGTWMGLARSGRWAALTNHRDPSRERPNAPSRGHLVSDFLRERAPAGEYLARLAPRADDFNGFNLLAGDREELYWFSNRGGDPRRLGPGLYGLSNHLLDTPWPKVVRGKQALRDLLAEPFLEPDALLDLLLDRTLAADHDLPDTGVGREWEQALSALFIASPTYGTRASTALLVDREGSARFVERAFRPGEQRWTEVRHELRLQEGA